MYFVPKFAWASKLLNPKEGFLQRMASYGVILIIVCQLALWLICLAVGGQSSLRINQQVGKYDQSYDLFILIHFKISVSKRNHCLKCITININVFDKKINKVHIVDRYNVSAKVDIPYENILQRNIHYTQTGQKYLHINELTCQTRNLES